MVVSEVTGSLGAARRRELGACLRSYRRLLGPESVGLPSTSRRRTPGLRREEVAALSGVGLSWYTWLEQGRVSASDHVLDSVGRVLGLDDVGRGHLRALSRPRFDEPDPDAPASLRPLLDSWPSSPAVLLDHRLDMVDANDAWARIWGHPGERAPSHRNVVRQLAVEPGPAVGDPTRLVMSVARQLRMASDLHAGDRRIAEVRDMLREDAPELGPVWDCRGVGAFDAPALTLQGRPVRAHLLRPTGGPDASILVLVPVG
ncbi:helix-turn-helix protein [Pseudonocardia sediminis]|uniref:Helix-turn-helix protein n=1 Tax=Pseudonocardia sediminis TaxID=1397368 RepID=A0A4Q7UYH1_PSEST|nr:helix-turn-helix transcriptional regulator [Pseudonocardia sediminis]RZT85219.1 helix-turn-helix protein [Pseudonocardia sediminis]